MISKHYNPKDFESRIYSEHEKQKLFKPEINPKGKPFTILFPPPNANASLHAGHAQRSTVQDIYTRIHRMEGDSALLIPGADHAGLQTATVFDKKLWREEGKTRFDLGFEEYHRQIYSFVEQMRFGIYDQFRKIGLSADFDREYFTIEPRLTKIIRRNFKRLWRDGLVYKGKYLVNWSYKAGTTLSDAETEEEEETTKLTYIKYPLITPGVRVWELNFTDEKTLNSLKAGTKTIETRALNPEESERFFGDIKKGDFIICANKNTKEKLFFKCGGVRAYGNLDELTQKEPPSKIVDGFESKPDVTGKTDITQRLKESYIKNPGQEYVDKINKNGIVAIDMEKPFLSNFSVDELLACEIEVLQKEMLKDVQKGTKIAYFSDKISADEFADIEPGEIIAFADEEGAERVLKNIKKIQFFDSLSSAEAVLQDNIVSIYESGKVLSFLENPEKGAFGEDFKVLYLEAETVLSDPIPHITVATTRPETMLGDSAVAVNPEDGNLSHLVGLKALLPVVFKEIPVIADERIEKEFGTGAVKITPAHDKLDYEIGKDHNLEIIEIIGKKNEILSGSGKYSGLQTEECRELLITDLTGQGFIEKLEDYTHTVKICERTKCKIENLLSDEWFLRVRPAMTDPVIKKIEDGEIKIIPERYKSQLTNFLANHHDWPLSRQIWWGHTIPVYYRNKETNDFEVSVTGKPECDFCFVRHAESEHNKTNIIAEASSELDKLTIKGREEAKKLGESLRNQKFDVIITAPANRSQQTAQILAEELGIKKENILIDTRIKERDYREFEGLSKEIFKNISQEEIDSKTETSEEIHSRVEDFIKECAQKFAGKKILVVTHSGTLKPVISYFEESISLDDSRYISIPHGSVFYYEEPSGEEFTAQGLKEETDTFDTWFSSGQLTYTALGGPNFLPDFQKFYPTHIHETAYEIRYLWTCRMLMFGNYFTGTLPYEKAIYSGWIMDEKGKKMSKSVGNVINPLDYIETFGADATRLALISEVGMGENARVGLKKVELQRNFLTKVWNSSRFLQKQFLSSGASEEKYDIINFDNFELESIRHPVNQFLIFKLRQLQDELKKLLEIDHLGLLISRLKSFTYDIFCDFYIEATKSLPEEYMEESRNASFFALFNLLSLLQPFAPFIAQEIFGNLFNSRRPLLLQKFFNSKISDLSSDCYLEYGEVVANIIDLIGYVRSTQNEFLKDASFGKIIVLAHVDLPGIQNLLGHFVKNIEVDKGDRGILVNRDFSIKIETDSLQKKKLDDLINSKVKEVKNYIERLEKKLSNNDFLEKADSSVVDGEKEKLELAKTKVETMQRLVN
jgi:valyl-tRNA synthetase/ASC-1-like (ASCH) protein